MELERVQVRLRPEEREAVRCEARRLGLSVSEVIRRAIEPLVRAAEEVDESDPLFAIIGIGGDSPSNAASDVDDVVYGDPHGDRRRNFGHSA